MSMMGEEAPEREAQPKRAFISYSWADTNQVDRLEQALKAEGINVWRDRNEIKPGELVSEKIREGLNASDFYILFITDSSSRSEWVKREVAYAFQLSLSKKTTIVPVLASNAELPFEFSGYLYIDFRKSVDAGISALIQFLKSQSAPIGTLSSEVAREAPSNYPGGPNSCEDTLRRAKLGDLRFAMSDRLTIQQVAIMWFDIFERRMDDEVNSPNVAMACVELLDRARRDDSLAELLKVICRNTPKLARHPIIVNRR